MQNKRPVATRIVLIAAGLLATSTQVFAKEYNIEVIIFEQPTLGADAAGFINRDRDRDDLPRQESGVPTERWDFTSPRVEQRYRATEWLVERAERELAETEEDYEVQNNVRGLAIIKEELEQAGYQILNTTSWRQPTSKFNEAPQIILPLQYTYEPDDAPENFPDYEFDDQLYYQLITTRNDAKQDAEIEQELLPEPGVDADVAVEVADAPVVFSYDEALDDSFIDPPSQAISFETTSDQTGDGETNQPEPKAVNILPDYFALLQDQTNPNVGFLRIYTTTLIYADLWLQLTDEFGYAPEPEQDLEEVKQEKPKKKKPKRGIFSFFRSNNEPEEAEIPEEPEQAENVALETAASHYFLRERRRVRFNEIHYFDHPRIGAIVAVWSEDRIPAFQTLR